MEIALALMYMHDTVRHIAVLEHIDLLMDTLYSSASLLQNNCTSSLFAYFAT